MTALLDTMMQIFAMVMMAVVPALLAPLVHRLAERLKLQADSEVRGYLMAALDRAVEFGLAEAKRRIQAGAAGAAPVLAAELARDYAQTRVPDALDRFGIDTTGLDQLIRARLPKPPGSTPSHG